MSLQTTSFTQDKEVLDLLDKLQRSLDQRRQTEEDFGFSDYFDGQYWYVDLVQEGGGVLGVALAGYTYVMEQAGIRFLKLAGTSAGAINTLLMASAGTPSEARSEKVIEHMASLDISSLVDGDQDVQNLVKTLTKEDANFLEMAFRVVRVLDDLKDHMGLNPGEEFYSWISKVLQGWGITTMAELHERMSTLPQIIEDMLSKTRTPGGDPDWMMAIVAADLSTEIKAVLPDMGKLYYEDVASVNPAEFVRASMSVPFFFYPWIKSNIPQDEATQARWQELTTYRGPHPEAVLFVDGGLLSNFPIDVFHDWHRVPGRPTFGVKLGHDQVNLNRVDEMSYTKLAGTMINAATKIRDRDFISQHPDFNQLVATIDIGDHDWLNFNIDDESKLDLFRRGARAAVEFLADFDWNEYKRKRQDQLYAVVGNVLGFDVGQKLDLAEASHAWQAQQQVGGSRTRGMGTRSLTADEVDHTPLSTRRALQQRMKYQYVYGGDYRVLYFCPNGLEEDSSHEMDMLKAIKGEGAWVNQLAAAQGKLKRERWDFVIIDIRQAGQEASVEQILSTEGVKGTPQVILYGSRETHSNSSSQVFAEAKQPHELIHVVLDALQRS